MNQRWLRKDNNELVDQVLSDRRTKEKADLEAQVGQTLIVERNKLLSLARQKLGQHYQELAKIVLQVLQRHDEFIVRKQDAELAEIDVGTWPDLPLIEL